MTDQIQQLHATYCRLTKLQIRLTQYHEHAWFEWAKCGYTEVDLGSVILHLKRGILRKDRHPGCLRFDNLIGRPELFENELAEARAHERGRQAQIPHAKRDVLAATGRPTAHAPTVRHVSEVDWQRGIAEMRRAVE